MNKSVEFEIRWTCEYLKNILIIGHWCLKKAYIFRNRRERSILLACGSKKSG